MLDDAGKPMFNALVMTDGSHSWTPGPENEPFEDATSPRTDAQGRFRVEALRPGMREVVVLADDFAPKVLSLRLPPARALARVVIAKRFPPTTRAGRSRRPRADAGAAGP